LFLACADQVLKGSFALDLFDEVEREIYRLMVTNNTEPLIQSQMFKLAAIVLQHPSYKLKSLTLVNNSRGDIDGNVANTFVQVAASAQGVPAGLMTPQQRDSRGLSASGGAPGTPVRTGAAGPWASGGGGGFGTPISTQRAQFASPALSAQGLHLSVAGGGAGGSPAMSLRSPLSTSNMPLLQLQHSRLSTGGLLGFPNPPSNSTTPRMPLPLASSK
jgi:hypothetical protein